MPDMDSTEVDRNLARPLTKIQTESEPRLEGARGMCVCVWGGGVLYLCVCVIPHSLYLFRYNLYVDCMLVEGVSDMDSTEVDKSLMKLWTGRWALVGV